MELQDANNNNNIKFNREPQLSDFYKPSDEMKEYQSITVGILGSSSGYILYKIFMNILKCISLYTNYLNT